MMDNNETLQNLLQLSGKNGDLRTTNFATELSDNHNHAVLGINYSLNPMTSMSNNHAMFNNEQFEQKMPRDMSDDSSQSDLRTQYIQLQQHQQLLQRQQALLMSMNQQDSGMVNSMMRNAGSIYMMTNTGNNNINMYGNINDIQGEAMNNHHNTSRMESTNIMSLPDLTSRAALWNPRNQSSASIMGGLQNEFHPAQLNMGLKSSISTMNNQHQRLDNWNSVSLLSTPNELKSNMMVMNNLLSMNTNEAEISNQAEAYAEQGIVGPWSASSASLLGDIALASDVVGGRRTQQEMARVKPKRPLSAYNIFFKEERCRILDQIPDSDAKTAPQPSRKRHTKPHGKIGFENLAKAIGRRWQALSAEELAFYKSKAAQDMKRYKREMEAFVSQGGVGASKPNEASGAVMPFSLQNFLQVSNNAQGLERKIFQLDG
jgi:hypothetical protein